MTEPSKDRTRVLIEGGVALFLLLFVGLGWVILWGIACGIHLLFQKDRQRGGIAAALFVLIFFVPYVVQDPVFARQMQAIHDQELSPPPIDLTGKRVLFIGQDVNQKADCYGLCQTIALFGAADRVYFGYDRSLVPIIGDKQIDLTERDIRTYQLPFAQGPLSNTPIIKAKPNGFDLIVVYSPYVEAGRRAELLDPPSSLGLFPVGNIYTEYLIYAPSNPLVLDPANDELLFSRFMVDRYRLGMPPIPGLATGTLDQSHKRSPDDPYWYSQNRQDATDYLCGPVEEPYYRDCTSIM